MLRLAWQAWLVVLVVHSESEWNELELANWGYWAVRRAPSIFWTFHVIQTLQVQCRTSPRTAQKLTRWVAVDVVDVDRVWANVWVARPEARKSWNRNGFRIRPRFVENLDIATTPDLPTTGSSNFIGSTFNSTRGDIHIHNWYVVPYLGLLRTCFI